MQEKKVAKTVYDTVYVVNGKEFSNKKDAEIYEGKLNGNIIDCPECNGKGLVFDCMVETYHSWEYDYRGCAKSNCTPHSKKEYKTCPKCKGKKVLTKTTQWV